MSRARQSEYEIDALPLNPIEPGTNVLVSGPESAGLSKLVHRLLATDNDEEGVVAISTENGGRRFLRQHRRLSDGGDTSLASVVDCSGSDRSGDNVKSVGDTSDLTAISMEFSALYDEVQYEGAERVRSALHATSPLCASCDDMRDVYRFLQNMTSRNRRSDGVFVCAIDPEEDTGDFKSGQSITAGISKAFHGHVKLRRDGLDTELKVEGLNDQPEGWQSVDL